MSLTKNGSRIGMAKHIENREFRTFLDEQYWKDRREKSEAHLEAERVAMKNCIALEGEESFSNWYDNDQNVPPFGLAQERTAMIEDRIARLKSYDQIAPSDQVENNRIQDWLFRNWEAIPEVPL